jgi:hypothetical protein
MSAPEYSPTTTADVNFSTVKTIFGVKAHANSGLILKEAWVTFQGVVSTGEPVTVELCYCTWATNSPGTNSTSESTIPQTGGRVITPGFTAGRNWTTEPTTITPVKTLFIHPQAGVIYQIPLGSEWDSAVSEGFVIRCTAAAAVDARAGMVVSRC